MEPRGVAADPFRLPKMVREHAFYRRGRDMDDTASYPRCCFDVFRAGTMESRVFLASREVILQRLGVYYFGSGVPEKKKRKWMKELFNALDNDGKVAGWRRRHGIPDGVAPIAGARVDLGGGQWFDLSAYQRSREDMTEEFEQLMPGMTGFVKDWLLARGDQRHWRAGITAKSYFLQEAEGLSRGAKVEWCRLRGDYAVTNLQHDGVVVDLPDDMDVASCEAAMSAASGAALGYPQPVEEKPIGEEISDSEDDAEGA